MTTTTQEPGTTTRHSRFSGIIHTAGHDVKPLQAFWTKFNNDGSMTWAAALAYNLLTAMFPIAIALLAVLGLVLGGLDPHAQDDLVARIQGIFPTAVSSGDVIKTILRQLARDSGFLGIIAILLAIFGGSRLFILVEQCFDIIYRLRPRPPLQQNIMAISMLLLFIVLTPIMVLASSGPAFVISILKNTPLSLIPGSSILFSLGGILGSLIVSWILFQAIYMVVPNRKISFRHSWLGAVIAAVLLEIYLTLFPLYAARFLGGYVGQVGFAIILLAFFYYFAVILLLGAEVNAFFSEGIRATPSDLVTLVHVTASKGGGDQPAATLAKEHKLADMGVQQQPGTVRRSTGADREIVLTPEEQQQHKSVKSRLTSLLPTSKADKSKEEPHTQPGTSRVWTMVEVVTGTALAFLVELVRLRRRKVQ